MSSSPTNPASLQILRIMHIALIAGPTLFLTLCLTVLKERMVFEYETYYLVGLAFGIMASVGGFYLPIILSKSMAKQNDSESSYQTIKIIQWAVLETGALLNAVFYYLTAKQESLIIALVLILVLVSRFPSQSEKDKWLPKSNSL